MNIAYRENRAVSYMVYSKVHGPTPYSTLRFIPVWVCMYVQTFLRGPVRYFELAAIAAYLTEVPDG